jgi:plasmid stability protein
MAQLLVRDLDDEVVATLKARARENRRSLQAEAKLVLEEAARFDRATSIERIEEVRRKLAHLATTDSTELVREIRDR